MLPIAVDVMSGDNEPREYLAGALRALSDDPELALRLVGDETLISATLAQLPTGQRERLAVVPATQIVSMEDKPREAIRRKKDSSLVRAAELVRDGKAAAMVSAGNTGATMASG